MEDLTLVDDDIFKIAVFEESGIENDGYCKLEERFGENFNVQLSGKYWTDIMNKGVTKGTALRTIETVLEFDMKKPWLSAIILTMLICSTILTTALQCQMLMSLLKR